MLWHHSVNSHQRWKQTRFQICFHLWCELTSTIILTEWQVSWNSCKVYVFMKKKIENFWHKLYFYCCSLSISFNFFRFIKTIILEEDIVLDIDPSQLIFVYDRVKSSFNVCICNVLTVDDVMNNGQPVYFHTTLPSRSINKCWLVHRDLRTWRRPIKTLVTMETWNNDCWWLLIECWIEKNQSLSWLWVATWYLDFVSLELHISQLSLWNPLGPNGGNYLRHFHKLWIQIGRERFMK